MSMKTKSVVLVLFQGEALPTSPAQQLEEVQAGTEDLIIFEHHFVKCLNRKVTTGVSIFKRGHRGVKSVCLMAKRGSLHGDDLVCMLGRKTHGGQIQKV